MADKLATALAVALRNYGIVATRTPAPGLKRITSTVQTRDAGRDIAIDITWSLREANGKPIGTNEQRALGKPQEWVDQDDRLVSRIAIQAAFRIGRQLGRGDPANVPIAALPDALGPGIPPPGDTEAGPPGTGPAPPAEPATGEPASRSPATASPGTKGPAVAAASTAPRVFVSTVKAPSAAGSRAMTAAMRRALGVSQMVLVNHKEPGSYDVQGTVDLSPPEQGRQRIVIRWFVKRADGTQVGDLEQANSIAAGRLEGNWDKLAPLVTLAAVDSIIELISRDRPEGSR